jgi:protease III
VEFPAAPPVTDAEKGVVIGVRPVRETRSMSIEFVLPQELDDSRTKPLQVVSAVLGTETSHSLVEVLRDKGLALHLSAGSDGTSLRNGVTLSLFVQLTEEGDRRRDEVLATIFAYWNCCAPSGLDPAYFDQLQRIWEHGIPLRPFGERL